MRSNSHPILSCCFSLRTQNPGLKEVEFKPILRELVIYLKDKIIQITVLLPSTRPAVPSEVCRDTSIEVH